MATVTVYTGATPAPAHTEPEPASSPNDYWTKDRHLSRRRLRTVLTIILTVSLFLQLIALATPGWRIVSTKSSEITTAIYTSVFYTTVCREKSCETMSRHDAYRKAMEGQTCFREDAYNLGIGLLQGSVVLSWVGTLLVVLVMGFIVPRKNNLLHAGPVLCALLAVIGIIMGEIIFVSLVGLDYISTSKEDTMKVGFSYSLFVYILACIQIFPSCFVVFKCFRDDLSALQTDLSKKGFLLDKEKRHVDYLREKLKSSIPRSSVSGIPMLRAEHSRDLRPSLLVSPRVSREVSPTPRPSLRPRDHQNFLYPFPRNSAEVRDYDRHSSRPANGPPSDGDRSRRDRHHIEYPRDTDRHRDRPRDHRDERSRDHRDERPRDYEDDRSRDHIDGMPPNHVDDTPRERRRDQSRDQREGENPLDLPRRPTTGSHAVESGDEHLPLRGKRSDYMPVADSSDSEMYPKTTFIEMTGVSKANEERTAGEMGITDVNDLAIDV